METLKEKERKVLKEGDARRKKKRAHTSYWIRHYRCRYTLNSRYAHRGGYEKIQ